MKGIKKAALISGLLMASTVGMAADATVDNFKQLEQQIQQLKTDTQNQLQQINSNFEKKFTNIDQQLSELSHLNQTLIEQLKSNLEGTIKQVQTSLQQEIDQLKAQMDKLMAEKK